MSFTLGKINVSLLLLRLLCSHIQLNIQMSIWTKNALITLSNRTKMSKRSRSCTITSINKPFENQINKIYNNYDQDKLTLFYSLKDVVEKNLKKVVTLSEEIGEGIEDHEEFATHLDESMNIEANINHKLAILNEFITKINHKLAILNEFITKINHKLAILNEFIIKKNR